MDLMPNVSVRGLYKTSIGFPSTMEDMSRYVDSGALDHLTKWVEQVVIKKDYSGI